MATFPALKTGAIAQYPSGRTRQFATDVYTFLDGGEQRFPGFGGELRQWSIALSLLDEGELRTLEQFFVDQGGRSGSFSLTDPWDATVHANCSFASDEFVSEFRGQGANGASVVVKENR